MCHINLSSRPLRLFNQRTLEQFMITASAFQRKGIKSVVLERSDTLRVTGAAIGILPNGWRALNQLGLESCFQSTSIPYRRVVDVSVDKGVERVFPIRGGDARCVRRSDLIETLANALPPETVRFGCQVVAMNVESSSSHTILQLEDGKFIKTKVLIGCDGANSAIADHIGLKPTQSFSTCSGRGLTVYPNGHGFAPDFLRVRRNKTVVGRMIIDENTAYWFVTQQWTKKDIDKPKDPETIRRMILGEVAGLSKDIEEMIENCDLNSLSFTRLRYRTPWDLVTGNFRRETVTLAGDALHVMGPFLGQGGSAALEDAIVLARCLSKKIHIADDLDGRKMHLSTHKAREALDEYLKERKRRVVLLSLQTYITGLFLVENFSKLLRFLCVIILAAFFPDPAGNTLYDCGEL